MREHSMEYFVVVYLLCYAANAQFTLDSTWRRSWGSSNFDMNGSGTQKTFFTVFEQPNQQVRTETRVEVSSSGHPQDPVNVVKKTMSQTSIGINPMRISTQQFPDQGFFNGHNPFPQSQQGHDQPSSSSTGFQSMGQFIPFQNRISSHSSFNPDPRQPMQTIKQMVSQSVKVDKSTDPVQSEQHTIFQSSGNMPSFRSNDRISTGSNIDRFGRVIQSEPQRKDSNVFPRPNRFSNVRKDKTAAPRDISIGSKDPSTISPNLQLVAQQIIESNKGKGIEFPQPLCIQLPDPVYNTLCLMRTEEASRITNITKLPNTEQELVKDTFKKAANLVSIVAQGMCAFCCHTSGAQKERCIKLFCETNPTC